MMLVISHWVAGENHVHEAGVSILGTPDEADNPYDYLRRQISAQGFRQPAAEALAYRCRSGCLVASGERQQAACAGSTRDSAQFVRLDATYGQAGAIGEPGDETAVGLALERSYVIEIDDVSAMDAREALAIEARLEPVQ